MASGPTLRTGRSFAPQRGQGRPARRNTRGSPSMRPCRAECCIRGRTAAMTAIASSSLTDETGRHGSTAASQQPSDFQMFPMPATLR